MKAKKLILSLIGGAILMAAYLAYFHASNQSYLSSFIVYICLFLIAGQGWNLLGGYIGEVSFGHAVFFGIGAYAVALPGGYNIDLPLPLLVILGVIIAGLFAWIISYPLLRIKGLSFLIGTFGLGVIFLNVFKSSQFLFASKGVFVKFVSPEFLYPLIVSLTILMVIGVALLVKSPLGLSFKAVRDVPEAAEMIGINLYRTKTKALVIGAMITGLAGALYALYEMHITPTATFDTAISNDILLGAYVGGCGTVMGPVIGGAILIIVQETARSMITVSGGHNLVLGLILILVMMLMKQGIWVGICQVTDKLLIRIRNKKEKKDENTHKEAEVVE